jgi:hypothetical protein
MIYIYYHTLFAGDPGAHFRALDPDEQAEVFEWQSKEPALRSAVIDKLRSAVLRESPQRRSTPFVMVKVCCSCCCDARGDAPAGADVASDVANSDRVTRRRPHRRCTALLRLWEPNESVVQLLQEGRCSTIHSIIIVLLVVLRHIIVGNDQCVLLVVYISRDGVLLERLLSAVCVSVHVLVV